MRPSITRKIEAAVATLAPDEPVVDTGIAWVFADRGRVPKLFRARRRCVVARTERRLVIWPVPSARRQLVGARPRLGAPLDQLTVERFGRARVLAALRIRTTAGATVVLELTPRARAFGGRLAAAVEAVPAPVGMTATTASASAAPRPAAAAPSTSPAISRGEVLKVVTDLRDGHLRPETARAWAVAVSVAGSPVAVAEADADAAWIGDIVDRLATAPPETAIGSEAFTSADRAQLDAWVTRLSER